MTSLAVVAAGCGGGGGPSGDGGSADPATVVPAGAAVYVEATVKPSGGLRDDALAAAGKVLRTQDPEAKIRELARKAFADTADGEQLDYDKDVAPWLGQRVALWVAAESGQEMRGVVLIATDDPDAARTSLDESAKRAGEPVEREHSGVTYVVDKDGHASGVIGDFAAAGSEPEFKRTIDAAKGDSLAEADRYRKATGTLAKDRVGEFYAEPKLLVEMAQRQDPAAAAQIQQAKHLFPIDRLGPVSGALVVDGSRLAVDTRVDMAGGADAPEQLGMLAGPTGSPLLKQLPGDAWAAVAYAKVGAAARSTFRQVAGGLGGAAISGELQRQLGIDLEQDVFSWIGDVGGFVRGTSADTVDGGLVIEVTDEARAAPAFGKLLGLVQTQGGVRARPVKVPGADAAFAIPPRGGSHKPVVMARGNGRVVVAYGEAAAAEGLAPAKPLERAGAYGRAKAALGDSGDPAFLVSLPSVVALVDAVGRADAGWTKAKPYLQAFDVLTAGGKVKGDHAQSRIAVSLK